MPPDPILPSPLVRKGDDVFPVPPLQQLLRARSHSIAVDGIFGPQTEGAVKAFQQSNSLTADGIVGPITWPKLVVQVKKGSTGDAVRGVQEMMKFHASPAAKVPGSRSTASSARAPTPSCAGSRPQSAPLRTASSGGSPGEPWMLSG